MIKLIDDSKDNKDLLVSYVLDYGDGYHRLPTDISSELESKTKLIRRRYRNQFDYINACSLYDEYMQELYRKYNGKKIFKLMYKEGFINDYVPPKPRMKASKINKLLSKKNIVLSSQGKLTLDKAQAKHISDELATLRGQEKIEIADIEDKIAKKIVDKGIKIDYGDMLEDNLDILARYFSEKKASNKDKTYASESNSVTLRDIVEGNVVDIKEELSDSEVIYYGNRMIERGDVKQLKLIEDFNKFGWNPIKIQKLISGRKNNAIGKILEQKQKKYKKLKKKKGKKKDSFDSMFAQILEDGDQDYIDFEKEMKSFTEENIFRR